MLSRRSGLRARALRGHAVSVVRTDREGYEFSERVFSQLTRFAFHRDGDNRMLSSGPRQGDWCVRLVSSTGHRIALTDEGKITCLIPYKGQVAVTRGDTTLTAQRSEVLLVGSGERETHLSPDYLGLMLMLPRSAADEVAAAMDDTPGSITSGVQLAHVTCPAAVTRAHLLVERMEMSGERPETQADWLQTMRPFWEALVLAGGGHGVGAQRPASLAQVWEAEAFMEAHSEHPLTLGQISRAAGIGPRALQMAFHRHRRYTPRQFLQDRRLHAARARLMAADAPATVTEAALDAGFSHLGRFSVAYQKAFGEPPSETRARGKHGSN